MEEIGGGREVDGWGAEEGLGAFGDVGLCGPRGVSRETKGKRRKTYHHALVRGVVEQEVKDGILVDDPIQLGRIDHLHRSAKGRESHDEQDEKAEGARVRSLVGKCDELVVRPSACIFCLGPVRIEEHHREASDALAGTERLVLLAVHLGNVELVLHASTKLGPCGRQLLAVAAPKRDLARTRHRTGTRADEPGCEKLDECRSLREEAVKILYVERDDRARGICVRAWCLYDELVWGGHWRWRWRWRWRGHLIRRLRRRHVHLFRRPLGFGMLFQKLDQEVRLSVTVERLREFAVAV